PYAGQTVAESRANVVADLEEQGLLVETEDREIELAHSDRSKAAIEPLLTDQWFVKMEHLAQTAMDAVTDGRVTIFPSRYTKGYLDWLSEKRDWPISRQLWWGHQIPIWYCETATEDDLKKAFAGSDAPLARVMTQVFKHDTSESPETTLLLLDDALEDVSGLYRRYLILLAALAGTAPFLGLLGTVLGIMNTFASIMREGFGGPTVIANGIAQALRTTAAGLVIAIPAFIAYNLFSNVATKAVRDLRMQANRIFVALGDL
ncbi:hypothetical protein LCGC14_2206420, partial [marine sediment metagenome]